MNKLFILLICIAFIFCGSKSYSQSIYNRLDLNLSVGIASPIGPERIEEGDFQFPSLFNNYNNAYSGSASLIYNFKYQFGAGLSYRISELRNWDYSNSQIYNESSTSIRTFMPVFKYRTQFGQGNIYKKLQLFGVVGPSFNSFIISRSQEVFDVEGVANYNPDDITFSTVGITGQIGLEYSVSQVTSIELKAGALYTGVDGNTFADNSLLLLDLSFGLQIKLFRTKQIYP